MKKTIYKRWLDSLNEDLYSLKILEGLGKKRRWCFWGGVDTPVHTMHVIYQEVLNAKVRHVEESFFLW